MTKKSQEQAVLTLRIAIKVVVLGVFLSLGLSVSGATIFDENFNSYNTGDLDSQDSWNTIGTPQAQVQTDVKYEGQKGLQLNTATSTKIGNGLKEGLISFYFLASSSDEFTAFRFRVSDSDVQYGCGASIYYASSTDIIDVGEHFLPSINHSSFENATSSQWHYLQIEWNTATGSTASCRLKLNNGSWSSWFYSPQNYNKTFDRVIIEKNPEVSSPTNFYIDFISDTEYSCGIFTDFNSCTLAGCYWGYYSLYLGGNPTGYCTDMPTGDCGSGYDDCQNCTSQANCEAQNFCFWYLDTCRYGETACAGTSLQLCYNQIDCENAGGYWYDDFCWLSPQPSYFTSWEDWYAEHGNYATPTAFIDSLASSTQGFFNIIGGFYDTFSGIFNLQDATERGKTLGRVVPVARGYMGIFNEFLGGFPISEFFILFLTFMLAIGIFRLVSRLIPLIKFW